MTRLQSPPKIWAENRLPVRAEDVIISNTAERNHITVKDRRSFQLLSLCPSLSLTFFPFFGVIMHLNSLWVSRTLLDSQTSLPLRFHDTAQPLGTLGQYPCASLFCQRIGKVLVHWEEGRRGQHLDLKGGLRGYKTCTGPGSVSVSKIWSTGF